jgi:fructose-1,6-bisphosphatase I
MLERRCFERGLGPAMFLKPPLRDESHVNPRAMSNHSPVTLERHIVEEERSRGASGVFSNVLYALTFAAKIISREVNKAGVVDILGGTGDTNVQGEHVQKLDLYAEDVIYRALDHGGTLCCMVSEESKDIIPIPDQFPKGKYVLIVDPLDGSSNIDVNIPTGTIFSIHKKVSAGEAGTVEDCLQPGSKQVAAGYVLYGSATMLVYTSGRGVHGFTLDPSIGEFLLSHPNVVIPDPPSRTYSINEAYYPRWSLGQQRLMQRLKGLDGDGSVSYSSRYIGSLVADFHRTLLKGGMFMYPADSNNPNGKLRLLYEAAPMAMICEQAGGRASDGRTPIMDLIPEDIHERTPLYIGSSEIVEMAEKFLAKDYSAKEV